MRALQSRQIDGGTLAGEVVGSVFELGQLGQSIEAAIEDEGVGR